MLHVSLVPIFSYSLIHNLFQHAQNIVCFTGRCACLSRPILSYSPIHDLFQHAQNIGFSQVNASCLSPVPFFSIP